MSCIVFHLASCLKQVVAYIVYKESLLNALSKKVFVKGFFKYIVFTEILLYSMLEYFKGFLMKKFLKFYNQQTNN
ncbi:hypothetical protein EWZ70_06255 [Helicobacter pylori]|nr:hypothetical protein [Helicobacter pylori]NHB00047.1 hypothetical protein [Helicobacter pylori]